MNTTLQKMPAHIFVAGTDTGIGKTHFCCHLIRAKSLAGQPTLGMKPIAAGAEWLDHRWINEDVIALSAASAIEAPERLINPYLLNDPISPHLAAERMTTSIEIATIKEAFLQLVKIAPSVVVEGAGGFLVPISEQHTGADLCLALNLPIILVVGIRLGCLSHAMLSVEAIQARRLSLVGWVANRIDPKMIAANENIAYLSRHIHAPLLMEMPFISSSVPPCDDILMA